MVNEMEKLHVTHVHKCFQIQMLFGSVVLGTKLRFLR